MQPFLGENFLLSSEPARRLYHDYAADEPIYDYHSHLPAADVASDLRFDNLSELWLDGDHYKWRAMRTAGVDERLITGDANALDRFRAFARIVPECVGNPIFHWTHMELKRPLGIEGRILSAETADEIWQLAQSRLQQDDLSARGILHRFGVRMLATTDDPVDSLEAHARIAGDPAIGIRVLPTWRPDVLLKPERPDFREWIDSLARAAEVEIASYDDLLEALDRRLDHFSEHACLSADHGIDTMDYAECPDISPESILERQLAGEPAGPRETVAWRSCLLTWLGKQYARRGWVMQLHIGAQRDNNSRMLQRLGPNSGYDSIGDESYARALAAYLDTLEADDSLPRTILYGLNPRDNEMLATMIGNFQGGGIAGRVQFGSAWWFNDQADGIRRHLTATAQMSLLSRFVGMLTDSRSLLSFSRHEYFRRILCDLIGGWIEAGEAPSDYALLGQMVRDISSRNTVTFFGLDEA